MKRAVLAVSLLAACGSNKRPAPPIAPVPLVTEAPPPDAAPPVPAPDARPATPR
jgi:hypothetical protein